MLSVKILNFKQNQHGSIYQRNYYLLLSYSLSNCSMQKVQPSEWLLLNIPIWNPHTKNTFCLLKKKKRKNNDFNFTYPAHKIWRCFNNNMLWCYMDVELTTKRPRVMFNSIWWGIMIHVFLNKIVRTAPSEILGMRTIALHENYKLDERIYINKS